MFVMFALAMVGSIAVGYPFFCLGHTFIGFYFAFSFCAFYFEMGVLIIFKASKNKKNQGIEKILKGSKKY
jgi:hypothetical protein